MNKNIVAIILIIAVAFIGIYYLTHISKSSEVSEQDNNTNSNIPQTMKAVLHTSQGNITVELYKDEAPLAVESFVKLAGSNFYDGTRFHRVIKDFMIQGGDPLSKDIEKKNLWGTGGPGYKFADQFNDHTLVRGSLAMANSGPDTNGSQFFIVTTEATPWLDGKHTNFGKVIEGMDIVDSIENLETDEADRPVEDAIINVIEIVK